MLANFHTHTTFCDGANTPEEIVRAAMDRGFSAVGFSGHGTTPFDLSYCMTDTEGYIAEITRIKETYRGKIRILLGVEEDALSLVDRARFDYLIGSSHYLRVGDTYHSLDTSPHTFGAALDAMEGDILGLARAYYETFCGYIESRRPDIVGHFDLLTKFDERGERRMLENPDYHRLAETYIARAAESGLVFEVNTGAMAKGYRTCPYPRENLLRVLKEKEAPILLSSDSHSVETLDFGFEELRRYLYDLGFRYTYTLSEEGFLTCPIR